MSDQAPFMVADEPESRAARRAHQAEADAALVGALGQAARVVASQQPAGPSPAAWHRLTRARAQAGRRAPRAVIWGALGAAACAAVAGLVLRRAHPAALTYDVRGPALTGSGQVEAGLQGTAVRFSDGTQIDLEAQARLAVSAAGPHGARLRLQSGAAHFRVMHLPHASWTVEAGPYVVEVTGTEFDVRWSEREQTVEVKMRSGSVRVSGPMLTERVALGKGQHLLARLGMGDVRIDDGRPAAAVGAPVVDPSVPAPSTAPPDRGAPPIRPAAPRLAPSPVEPPYRRQVTARPRHSRSVALSDPAERSPLQAPVETAPVEPSTGASAGRTFTAAARWTARHWSSQVAAGQSEVVVSDAEEVGLDTTMRLADVADLSALADAARYAGRPELAERAFSATRSRFSGTSSAHTAAFLLGRMADDRGDSNAGLGWYRAYLAEAPSGPFAAEALGREMMIVRRVQGRQAALSIARDYLARFPNGTYLLEARAVIENR